MKKTRRITAILLALLLCLALVACGNADDKTADTTTSSPPPASGTTPSPALSGDNIVTGDNIAPPPEDAKFADRIEILTEMPLTMVDCYHPAGGGNGERAVYRCIFDRLVIHTRDNEILPELATRWETNDNQTYTFYLRDDVSFHNGQKFTAQDVLDTIWWAQEYGVGSNGYEGWRDVVSSRAINDYTVEITLNDVNVDFLWLISQSVCSIINRAAREADSLWGLWVGTGAFRVVDQLANDHMTLERNDDYWGEAPITKTLNFQFIPEMAARAIMLQNGEAHMAMAVGPEDLQMFMDDPVNYTIFNGVHNLLWNLYLNTKNPITGDLNFRMAVAHALNIPEIAVVAVGIQAIIPSDGSSWGYAGEFRNTDIPLFERDLDLAREYLAASSYKGEPVVMMAGIPPNIAVQDLIAEQLGEIGINIEIYNTDNASIIAMDQNNPDTQIINGLSPFSGLAASARNMFLPTGGANRGKYDNQEVIDLLMRAPSVADRAEREAMYKRVQEIVAQDVYMLPLFYRMSPIIARSSVGGFAHESDHDCDYRWVFMVVD